MKEYQLYINGGYQPAKSGRLEDSINPANGEIYAQVHQANVDDATEALDVAWEAFQSWKEVGPSEREGIFLRAAQIMEARAEELRDILIDEAGSTMLKAGYETHHAPMHVKSMAGECRRVVGDTYLSDYPGVKSYCILVDRLVLCWLSRHSTSLSSSEHARSAGPWLRVTALF